MDQPMGSSTAATPEGKPSRKVLWIVLGVLLVCCVCGGGGAALWWLWNNGDQLLQGVSGVLSSPVLL